MAGHLDSQPHGARATVGAADLSGRPLQVHLNLNVQGLSQSATLAINERCAELIQSGQEVYRLGLGQSPFPVPQPVVTALQTHANEKDYLPVKGLPALRQSVADYYQRLEGLSHTADDVLIGPGTKELMFILALVYSGDLVLPTPSWVSYAPQGKIVGRRVEWVPTDPNNQWRLTPQELNRVCATDPGRPRVVILNYPSNPTGATYSPDQLQALADVARQESLIVLSDEIYGGVDHSGEHVSMARYYPEGTIVSNGLSKWCGAGGWRLGAFAFPPELRWLQAAMATVASETYTSTSAPIQYAAVRAFQGGPEIERYLSHSRRVLRALGQACAHKLTQAGASLAPPEGGFYLFPDFTPLSARLHGRGITSSPELCRRLLEEQGVAVLPGTVFGRPAQELTLRLAYVDFDGESVLAASEQQPAGELDEAFLQAHCGKVLKALDLLCEWVSA